MEQGPNLKIAVAAIILVSGAFLAYVMTQPETAPVIEKPEPVSAEAIPSEPERQPVQSPLQEQALEPSAPAIPSVSEPAQALPAEAQPQVTPEGSAHTILTEDFAFKPQNLTIPVGTQVDWMYGNAKYKHKVHIKANKEAETPGVQSPMLERPGDSWNHTFVKEGIYEYVDVILPTARGWIIVK